jgi:AraC-like DNA-binding protein
MMREIKRSLIEIALEVGYTSPSEFPQVFRPVVGVSCETLTGLALKARSFLR